MKTISSTLLILGLLLNACSHPPRSERVTVEPIPMKSFFRNPESSGYKISPDGTQLAFLKPYEKRMNLFVSPVGRPDAAIRITSETDRGIPYFFWKGNEHLIFARDFGGDENFHVFSVHTQTKKQIDLTPYPETKARVIDDLREISDTDLLVSHNQRDKKIYDVYRINIQSGKSQLVAKNPGKITSWVVDHKGAVRIAVETNGVKTTLLYRKSEKKPFKKLITTNFKNSLSPLFFTFDNKNIYAASNLGRDKIAIVQYNLSTRKEDRVIFRHSKYDASGLTYSPKRKVLLAAQYTSWKSDRKFLDKKTKESFNWLQGQLPKYEVRITSRDKKEETFIVRTFSDRSLGSYYLYHSKKRILQKISDISPWLDENQLAEMKPIQYKSRDGLTIHGYLTLPRVRSTKNLPLIVNPHGGPWHRDRWGFNPTAQFLANRGYAVLQMNFRGSTGYGKKFWKASFKQWGKKMQDDVTDGVQWLIKKGTVDAKKICIYGASYGGYATLAGVAFTPDLYRCGIDYVGISSLFTFIETLPPYWLAYKKMLHEMVGHPEKDKALLESASPLFHTDKIKAALMIAQGAKDPRVKKSESDQIVEALRKRGIDVPYIVKDNEGHGFRNEENRFEFYEEMEAFLAKHLLTKNEG